MTSIQIFTEFGNVVLFGYGYSDLRNCAVLLDLWVQCELSGDSLQKLLDERNQTSVGIEFLLKIHFSFEVSSKGVQQGF